MIREERELIWETKPKEVDDALMRTMGTYGQSLFPALYAESTTRGLCLTLMCIRNTARRDATDLGTLKMVLTDLLNDSLAYLGWCGLDDTTALVSRACSEIDKIGSKKDFIDVLEQLTIYFNRLHYWIDECIPWYELVGVYEWAKKGA